MALDIKICGLKTPAAIDAAIARGASHVGFILFEKSPRHLSLADMAGLSADVAGRAERVVVMVDPDDALLLQVMQAVRPDMIQLHGAETPERVARVKALTGSLVMKALAIGSAEDIDRVAAYQGVADRLLLDAKKPKASQLPGGNGVSFDWRLLDRLDPGLHYMLSGGLDAGNVAEALRVGRPGGIDVSSGVESAPGVKDTRLIHRFFDALDAASSEAAGGAGRGLSVAPANRSF